MPRAPMTSYEMDSAAGGKVPSTSDDDMPLSMRASTGRSQAIRAQRIAPQPEVMDMNSPDTLRDERAQTTREMENRERLEDSLFGINDSEDDIETASAHNIEYSFVGDGCPTRTCTHCKMVEHECYFYSLHRASSIVKHEPKLVKECIRCRATGPARRRILENNGTDTMFRELLLESIEKWERMVKYRGFSDEAINKEKLIEWKDKCTTLGQPHPAQVADSSTRIGSPEPNTQVQKRPRRHQEARSYSEEDYYNSLFRKRQKSDKAKDKSSTPTTAFRDRMSSIVDTRATHFEAMQTASLPQQQRKDDSNVGVQLTAKQRRNETISKFIDILHSADGTLSEAVVDDICNRIKLEEKLSKVSTVFERLVEKHKETEKEISSVWE